LGVYLREKNSTIELERRQQMIEEHREARLEGKGGLWEDVM